MTTVRVLALLLCPIALAIGADKKSTTNGWPERTTVTPGFELIDVTVFSVPSDARVEVGGTPAGHTPGLVRLRPGDYRLTVLMPGYELWEQSIKIQVGQPQRINAELRPKVKSGAGAKAGLEKGTVLLPGMVAPDATKIAPPAAAPDAGKTEHEVKYEVNGSGQALVTYRTESGNTEPAEVTLPWSFQFPANSGRFVMLSAQRANSKSKAAGCSGSSESSDCPPEAAVSEGPIESIIYVDGNVFQKNVSAPGSGATTAGGIVP